MTIRCWTAGFGILLIGFLLTMSVPYAQGSTPIAPATNSNVAPDVGFELRYTLYVNNTQNVPTETYQQSFSFDPCFVLYLHSNLSNLRIAYPNGTPVQTWIQTAGCPTSTIWMRLNDIPAKSSQQLTLVAEPSFQLSAAGPTGEAPLLSPVYGEWDNGAHVFTLYDNFSRTQLSNLWQFQHPTNVAYSVRDGLNLSSDQAPEDGGISSVTALTGAYWAEIDVLGFTQDGGAPSVSVAVSPQESGWNPGGGGPNSSYETAVNDYNASYQVLTTSNSSGNLSFIGPDISYLDPPGLVGIAWVRDGLEAVEVNSTEFRYSDSSVAFGPYHVLIGISGAEFSVTSTHIDWARVRVYPPNGIMPSVAVTVELTMGGGGASSQSTMGQLPPCATISSSVPIVGGQCEAITIAFVAAVGVITTLSALLLRARKLTAPPPGPPSPTHRPPQG